MDSAVRAVRRAVPALAAAPTTRARVGASALVAAAPRPADAPRLLDLAGAVQPREDRAVDPARVPLPAVPAGANAAARVRPGAAAPPAAPCGAGVVAGGGRAVPGRVQGRAQRHQLERDRRRLRRR